MIQAQAFGGLDAKTLQLLRKASESNGARQERAMTEVVAVASHEHARSLRQRSPVEFSAQIAAARGEAANSELSH
jgi:hypothetical protein